MSDIDNGGAAFPRADDVANSNAGMSLRDWFAGQALTGILADENHIGSYNSLAQFSYQIADAMLEARK